METAVIIICPNIIDPILFKTAESDALFPKEIQLKINQRRAVNGK